MSSGTNGESYKIVGVPNVEGPSCIQIYHCSGWFYLSFVCSLFKDLLVCVSNDSKRVVWNMESKRGQVVSFPDEHYSVHGNDIHEWTVEWVLCG